MAQPQRKSLMKINSNAELNLELLTFERASARLSSSRPNQLAAAAVAATSATIGPQAFGPTPRPIERRVYTRSSHNTVDRLAAVASALAQIQPPDISVVHVRATTANVSEQT